MCDDAHESGITNCRSAAFTLVELLVVITIIGILVALLLPAVQAAREAARRMACSNNFKQVGVALHNHHAAKSCFPPGMICWVGGGTCGPQPEGQTIGFGWTTHILPYLEMQTFYDQLDLSKVPEDMTPNGAGKPSNFKVGGTRISAYICPSDPADGELVAVTGAGTNGNNPNEDLAQTNMVGVTDDIDWTCDSTTPIPGGLWPTPYWLASGMMGDNMGGNISEVKDGTSNTLMVAEFVGGGPKSYAGAEWPYGFLIDTADGINGPNTVIGGQLPWDPYLGARHAGPASYHPGGCHFLMGDGGVHFFSENIAHVTLVALTTRDGPSSHNKQKYPSLIVSPEPLISGAP